MTEHDDDFLDGCSLDFNEDPDDDETASLRPLFPDGTADPERAAFWRDLDASRVAGYLMGGR